MNFIVQLARAFLEAILNSEMEEEGAKRKASGRRLLRYLRKKSHMKRKIMANEVWFVMKLHILYGKPHVFVVFIHLFFSEMY